MGMLQVLLDGVLDVLGGVRGVLGGVLGALGGVRGVLDGVLGVLGGVRGVLGGVLLSVAPSVMKERQLDKARAVGHTLDSVSLFRLWG